MKIYVASSWRTIMQPAIVVALRHVGHEVYDFRNPSPGVKGFNWREVNGDYLPVTKVSPETALEMMQHPIAVEAFKRDMKALDECGLCVLVLPSGRSAHLETGYAAGKGKRTIVCNMAESEPDLMHRMCDNYITSWEAFLDHFDIKD